jgi:hypothetical protein
MSEDENKKYSPVDDMKVEEKFEMLNKLSGILYEFKNIFQPLSEDEKDNPPKSPECSRCGCGVCPYSPNSILLKGSKGRLRR